MNDCLKRFPAVCVLTLFCAVAGAHAASAQGRMPSGDDIARAAKAAGLNRGASATTEKDGMKVTVTPTTTFSAIKTAGDLEKGHVVAVVDITGARQVPSGTYNVFLVKSSGQWQAFLESGGKIVKQCKSAEVTSPKAAEGRMSVRPNTTLAPNCACSDTCNDAPFPNRVCARLCYWCD